MCVCVYIYIYKINDTPAVGIHNPPPAFLPIKFYGQRNLVGYSPWACKELDIIEHKHDYIYDIQQYLAILCVYIYIFIYVHIMTLAT